MRWVARTPRSRPMWRRNAIGPPVGNGCEAWTGSKVFSDSIRRFRTPVMVVAAFNEPVAAAPSMTPDTAMNACELNQNNRAVGSSHFENVQCRARMRRKALASHSNRSEEHTSELQSLMHISYAVFCLKKKKYIQKKNKS